MGSPFKNIFPCFFLKIWQPSLEMGFQFSNSRFDIFMYFLLPTWTMHKNVATFLKFLVSNLGDFSQKIIEFTTKNFHDFSQKKL